MAPNAFMTIFFKVAVSRHLLPAMHAQEIKKGYLY
jgi:hypothetical protein